MFVVVIGCCVFFFVGVVVVVVVMVVFLNVVNMFVVVWDVVDVYGLDLF